MPYSFSDANGILGPGPTTTGWKMLKQLAADNGDNIAFGELAHHGMTNKLATLAIACRGLIKKTDNPDLQASLKNIEALTHRAEECLILSHTDN